LPADTDENLQANLAREAKFVKRHPSCLYVGRLTFDVIGKLGQPWLRDPLYKPR